MKDTMGMAREAGFMYPVSTDGYMGLAYDYRVGKETGGSLKAFEALVRADERKACAKMCDAMYAEYPEENQDYAFALAAQQLAAAIRARGNT